MPLEHFTLPPGEVVLVDAMGSKAAIFHPQEETGVVVELAGRLNKLEARHLTSYVMPPETAGQLCREISEAVVASGSAEIMEAFNRGLRGEGEETADAR